MTATCPSTVEVKERFKVKYVLLNNLQDFLSVRLVWTPEGGLGFCCCCCCWGGEGLRFISAGNAELRFSGDGGRRLCFQGAVRARTRRRRRWCATAPSATWANVARAAL